MPLFVRPRAHHRQMQRCRTSDRGGIQGCTMLQEQACDLQARATFEAALQVHLVEAGGLAADGGEACSTAESGTPRGEGGECSPEAALAVACAQSG